MVWDSFRGPLQPPFHLLCWSSKQLFPLPTLDGNAGPSDRCRAPLPGNRQGPIKSRPHLHDHSTPKCSHL